MGQGNNKKMRSELGTCNVPEILMILAFKVAGNSSTNDIWVGVMLVSVWLT